MKKLFLSAIFGLFFSSLFAALPGSFTVKSPNGNLRAVISINKSLSYYILHDQDTIIAPSGIAMSLNGGEILGENLKVKAYRINTNNSIIETNLYKRKTIKDNYNELVITFKNDFSIIFRAYDEGIAYRFVTSKKQDIEITNEKAEFNFSANYLAYIPYVKVKNYDNFENQFFSSFQNTYTYVNLSKIDAKKLTFMPLVVEIPHNKKVCITEADLENYPGMYLHHSQGNSLTGVFAPYPKKVEQGGHNELQLLVKERENYIARGNGSRSFPWRVIAVSTQDKQLADNDLIYKLASPSRVNELTWIKPGKVAWDWWNNWNIYGVDFKSGINNETYKYYIDFASKNKIEYVILDEGWAVNLKADLMQVVPEINLKELIDYAKKHHVEIILWAGYYAVDRDMENVFKHYSDLGVKGFKIDFMNRDDQLAVEFYYRAAKMAAKYKLMLDFHGAYKPTGLQRTYPNVINFEGVHGLEELKWASNKVDQVTYDVTIPYIRMLAGPMDYTQGAMRNAIKKEYAPVYSNAMSQGTRCRQLAQYVIFESPLNMLCDNPTNYMREQESTSFIASVPTVWDETIALDGKIAAYIALARKKDKDWYVGVLTNWDSRTIELDFQFIGEGNYKAEVFRDGINADRQANDYKHEIIDVPSNRKLTIAMASGGGYVARIFKVK